MIALRRGAKKKVALSPEQVQSAIIALQEKRKGGRIIGKDIREWLEETQGVCYSTGHIYNWLKAMGISWVTARSRHPKYDAKQQADFKKNFGSCQ